MTTGQLSYIGEKRLGAYAHYDYYRCVDCGTDYPRIDGVVRCNGDIISRCPWCRPDSKPWKNGRGK